MKKFALLTPILLILVYLVIIIVLKDEDKQPDPPRKQVLTISMFSIDKVDTILIVTDREKIYCQTKLSEQLADTLKLELDSCNGICVVPLMDTNQSILIKEVYLDTLKLNSPWGWNCDFNEDYVTPLPSGKFIMNFESEIAFIKPDKRLSIKEELSKLHHKIY